jgi:Protein of unknown function (DUF4236)
MPKPKLGHAHSHVHIALRMRRRPRCAIPYVMSLGFRKAFSSGPFRMTFSKSGMSMSVGAGGARITAGPRGTHVSFSKGGFYYRTCLDPPGRSRMDSRPSPPRQESLDFSAPPVPPPVEATAATSSSEPFGAIPPDAVVEDMNHRIRSRNYALPAGIVVSGALLAASAPWPVVASLVSWQPSSSQYSMAGLSTVRSCTGMRKRRHNGSRLCTKRSLLCAPLILCGRSERLIMRMG